MSTSQRSPAVRRKGPARPSKRAVATAPEPDGRERILATAIRTFSEVGYAGATTAGIARDAGVTQPLVHHHFGSKEGLWRAAVDAVFATVPHVPAPAGGRTARDGIATTVELFVRFVAEHPEATRIVAREGATPSPRLDYLLERHLRAPFRGVVELLRSAQKAGTVNPDVRPELCLFLVLGAGSHLFDVSALAERSHGIDTTSARTRDAFATIVRTVLEHGLFRRSP